MSAFDFYRDLGVSVGWKPSGEVPVRCFNAEAHHHGDRNRSASVNLDTGLWNCHACGAKGSAYDAAIALGRAPADAQRLAEENGLWIDRPDNAATGRSRGRRADVPTTDQLDSWTAALCNGAVDRLTELRGWTAQAIDRLGLGLDGDRVVFPVRDRAGDLVGVLRYAPNPERRNGRKMLATRGSRRELFPPVESLPDSDQVWVVEGEPDVVAVASVGLPAVGIPGVEGWRDEWAVRFAGRQVIVCFDCDAPGRKAARAVAAALFPHAADVRVLDLGPARDDGYDLGDLIAETKGRGDHLADCGRLLSAMADATEPMTTEAKVVDTVDISPLLAGVRELVTRFVDLPDGETAIALSLWVVHTHCIAAADTTPYLAITSPEKRCGKSLLEEILELLVRRPWKIAAPPTEAVLFRMIDARQPTLLLDEADRLFKSGNERVEPLVAILNAGHRRGATVPRCVGEGPKLSIRDFSVFGAKALAGINGDRWPDTVRDRSIPVRLQRRPPGRKLERFRRRRIEPEANALLDQLAQLADDHVDGLKVADPHLPDELNDRAADGWEPLLALADAAGGDWPQRARDAALKLSAGHDPDTDSLGVRLLADVRDIFADRDRLTTADALAALRALDEAPWGDLGGGAGINTRRLASLLKAYGIRSRNVRLEDGTTPKGWLREQFEGAWRRYLPPEPGSIRHNATSQAQSQESPHSIRHTTPSVADTKTPENPHSKQDVAGVADSRGQEAA